MPSVFIILSTYNGEKFLDEQLLSLKQQTIPFHLLVRDDGSTDKTLDILNHWKDLLPMNFFSGENVGPQESFNLLLQAVPKDSDYIFFCDQDDFWEKKKIEKSLQVLQKQEQLFGKNTPLLFHSDLSVVDEELKFIHKSFWKFQGINWRLGNHLNRLVMQNTVTGCSALMNASLLHLVKQIPKEAKMHDWWIALVASSFGKIITLDEPLIKYRIHKNNVVGGKAFSFWRIVKTGLGIIRYIESWKLENKSRIKQIEAFYKIYASKLPVEKKEMLEKFLLISNYSFWKKKYYQCKFQFFQHGWYRIIISFLLF
jgi:glycosyltransferase involved in cell wall biosynthesis